MTTLRELCNKAIALDKDSDEFGFALSDILQGHGIDFNGVGALETVIAALDAEREAGRREALGDVLRYAEQEARACFDTRLRLHSKGDAFEHVARWCAAREASEYPLPARSGSGTEDSTADGREGGE